MKRTLIAGTVAALFTLPALAAQVPAGTKLLPAAQQTFVRNIGTEPASIDPQMVEESAGSDIVNDLFEGSTPWMATASCRRPAPLATSSMPRAPSTPSSSDPMPNGPTASR
jgi:ABC-type oligopeptide transport system substrate-binding subunit